MPEITIHIFPASEGGYMYDIYLGSPEDVTELDDSFDGGHCTTTIKNALEMAADQALISWESRQDLLEEERYQRS